VLFDRKGGTTPYTRTVVWHLKNRTLTINTYDMRILILIILIFTSCQVFGQNSIQNSNDSIKIKRGLIKLPSPIYNVKDTGTVILKVWINQDGYVINSIVDTLSSTTSNDKLIKSSLKASKDARFSKIEIDTIMIGTVTYNFKLR